MVHKDPRHLEVDLDDDVFARVNGDGVVKSVFKRVGFLAVTGDDLKGAAVHVEGVNHPAVHVVGVGNVPKLALAHRHRVIDPVHLELLAVNHHRLVHPGHHHLLDG